MAKVSLENSQTIEASVRVVHRSADGYTVGHSRQKMNLPVVERRNSVGIDAPKTVRRIEVANRGRMPAGDIFVAKR